MSGFESLLNVHPLFVHFPIAITILALVFEGAARLNREKFPVVIATALIYSAALAAIVTVLTGFHAAGTLGHDSPGHELVHTHREFMLFYSALIVVLALGNFIITKRAGERLASTWRKVFRPGLLVVATVVLVLGSDVGGLLVFRHGMGVRMEAPTDVGHDNSTPGSQNRSQTGADESHQDSPEHGDSHEHEH